MKLCLYPDPIKHPYGYRPAQSKLLVAHVMGTGHSPVLMFNLHDAPAYKEHRVSVVTPLLIAAHGLNLLGDEQRVS